MEATSSTMEDTIDSSPEGSIVEDKEDADSTYYSVKPDPGSNPDSPLEATSPSAIAIKVAPCAGRKPRPPTRPPCTMDVFQIDQSLTGTLGGVPSSAADVGNHGDVVSFEAGSEFNLCFFDSTEDNNTQGGFSDTSLDPASPDSPSAPAHTQQFVPLHIQTPPQITVVVPSDNTASSGNAASDPSCNLLSPEGAASSSGASQEQSNYVAADSNSTTTIKTFVPCKVCGDKASGYHYGVTSCEGCKGFFRRSIQKQIEYRCLRDGKCLVIRLNRNRCQYCRFKKCLAVGMSRDSVRYGRVPKRSRERSTDDTPSPRVSTTAPDVITVASVTPPTPVDTLSPSSMNSNPPSIESESKPLSGMYDVILGISQAHHANCCYTEEKTRGLQRRSLVPPPRFHPDEDDEDDDGEGEGVASSTAESMENDRCWYWQQFATCMTPSVQRVVEFAKRVPGFGGLGQDDQLILIKIGFFEIWLTHIARLTNNQNMVFDDGTLVTRSQLELMYDNDYITSIVHFAHTFNSLALNDTEIGLFSAVVLMTADRPGVTDVKSIEHHQDKLIEALKIQLARNHTNDSEIFSTLLIKLPELRNLGNKHTAHLDWFRVNWQRLALPPLFAEIFDIPKNDDDMQ